MRGEPQPIAGAYTPSCDQDGYYLPRQCRTVDKDGNKECWCVDRHGSKIEGATECGEQKTGFTDLKLLLFDNLVLMNCGQLGLAPTITFFFYHNCSSFFDELELFCTRTN